jgi:hypothetical protein
MQNELKKRLQQLKPPKIRLLKRLKLRRKKLNFRRKLLRKQKPEFQRKLGRMVPLLKKTLKLKI